MMICSSVTVCVCSRAPGTLGSVRPAVSSATTARAITAGSPSSSATVWRSCAPASAARRACPISWRPSSRNASWPSPSASRDWARGASPRRLRRVAWGGLVVSASGVFKVLSRHGISTRRKRLSLVAGYAAPPEPQRAAAPEPAHLEADHPGALVQLDCFHIGRLTGTRGRVWQYTAIDVRSSFVWGELHVTPLNPAARHCSALVRRVASELAAAGWKLEAISTDNGSGFRSGEVRTTVATLGAEQRFIRAGRPQTNGCVERVQRTILEECWRPTFAKSLVPKFTALRRDLVQYLGFYNHERAHTGRRSDGQTPAELVYGARKMRPR